MKIRIIRLGVMTLRRYLLETLLVVFCFQLKNGTLVVHRDIFKRGLFIKKLYPDWWGAMDWMCHRPMVGYHPPTYTITFLCTNPARVGGPGSGFALLQCHSPTYILTNLLGLIRYPGGGNTVTD